jgi:hypothetical protein
MNDIINNWYTYGSLIIRLNDIDIIFQQMNEHYVNN